MLFRFAADVVVAVHFLFVAFVLAGGFLAWRWRRLAWVHLPAAAWGTLIEFAGWVCPLTPLENALRSRAGESGFAGGFIEHYIVPVLYPSGLTVPVQVILGAFVVVLNVVAYWRYFKRLDG